MNERQQRFFEQKAQALQVQLNPIQQQAVVQTDGPLLLLASPGSGKTTTIIMRIGYMIEVLGIHPSRIKAVTFSRASANDMKARFAKFFPHLPAVHFSTIHSLAYEVVREQLHADGVPMRILEDEKGPLSKKRIINELYEKLNKSKATEDQLEELLTYISYVKNKLLPESAWQIADVKIPNKVQILKQYEEFKQQHPDGLLIDFDDMLVMAHDIFTHNTALLTRYQQRYDYFLTDESQDTSRVQHLLIEQLVAPHENICVVADEDQSIYSWRGAEVDYLLNFKTRYPNAEVLMMVQNYRSSSNIVDAANRFIKRNKKRYNKEMFTDNAASTPIKFLELSNYNLQASYLVEAVNAKQGTVAILYRNNTSAIPLLDAFERAQIPFYMKDSTMRFFKHWIVEDVLNFMRLAYNTKNVNVFEKVYNKMHAYLTPTQLQALKQVEENICVFDKLLEHVPLKDYQPEYVKKIKKAYARVQFDKTKPSDFLELIRQELGYDRMLSNMSERLGFNYDKLIDILEVLQLIAQKEQTLTSFAQRLKALEQFATTSHHEEQQVTFATLHSAKGLEFDAVYLIDCIEGVLPNVDPTKVEDRKQQSELEEEVRLFYVGITRAIRELQIISYKRRFTVPTNASVFMRELQAIVESKKANVSHQASPKKAPVHRNGKTFMQASELQMGERIWHVTFGEGEITALSPSTIELDFDGTRKKFLLATCFEQGYLERLP